MGIFIKSKKEKQEDAEIKDYLDMLDKLDKEAEDETEKINLKDLFKKDPLEEELKSYYTEEQLKEEEQEKKDATKFSIITGSILLGLFVFIFVGVAFLHYATQDDLYKIHQVDILNYYKNRYGTNTKINDISYICYKNEDKEKVCTDIVYAINTDGNVLIKNNTEYADDISTSKYYEDYKAYLNAINPDLDLIYSNPEIFDMDYSPVFKRYINYAKALPYNKCYSSLMSDNKLNIIDTIAYQGELNLENMKDFMTRLKDKSRFVFIKMNRGIPSKLTILDTNTITILDVTGTTYPDENITNYQLDSVVNNISNLYITKLTPQSIETLDKEFEYTNAYQINIETGRAASRDEEPKPQYYLLMFNGLIDGDNLYQFTNMKELDRSEYKDFYYVYFGGQTYIVGNSNLSFGNKTKIQKGLFN